MTENWSKRIIRKITALLLAGAMVFVTTACGNPAGSGNAAGSKEHSRHGGTAGAETENSTDAGTENETGDTVAEAPGKPGASSITVMCSQGWIKDAEKELGKRFEEETGIQVDYQIIPADQYQDRLLSRLNSGDAPDIWGAQSGFALETVYNVTENAVDLTKEDWADAYSSFSAFQTSVNGVNYGLTYFDTTTDYYMVYNKKLFSNAGAEVPTTWRELLETCEKLSSKGIIPIYEPVADGWHTLMLLTENMQVLERIDPGFIDKLNKNTATFAGNRNMQKAVEELNELAEKGYFGENYLSDEVDESDEQLAAGKYAMCMLKAGTIGAIVESEMNTEGYTEEDFGLFLLPVLDNQYLNVHPTGPSRFIYSGSENIEAAKKYLSFLCRKESVQYMIDNSTDVENLPLDVGQTPSYSRTTKEFLDRFDEENSGMVLQDTVLYFNEQWMDINADLSTMFMGDMTALDVLRSIDQRRAALAEEAGDENWK